MKIFMSKTVVGTSNKEGTATMPYQAGQSYDMAKPWQEELAQVFIDNGFADVETKVVKPAETKKKAAPKKRTPKKKA